MVCDDDYDGGGGVMMVVGDSNTMFKAVLMLSITITVTTIL